MTTLLATFCGRKGYLARALRRAHGQVRLVGVDADPEAPCRGEWDVFETAPRLGAGTATYVERILTIACHHHVDAVMSINDADACILATARPLFARRGIRLLSAPAETTEQLGDKRLAADWFTARGWSTPDTRTLAEVRRDGLPGEGPWIAKARRGQGSAGLVQFDHPAWVELLSNDLVIQPMVFGRHFDLDLLRDEEGGVVVGAKEKLEMSGGTASLTCSTTEPSLLAFARRLAADVGHIGAVDADVIIPDDGGPPVVLEVNARVGGCLAHAILAAPGLADALLDIASARRIRPGITTVPGVTVYRDPHAVAVNLPTPRTRP